MFYLKNPRIFRNNKNKKQSMIKEKYNGYGSSNGETWITITKPNTLPLQLDVDEEENHVD